MLVAYRTDSFLINTTACIYSWIDYVNNVYINSVCYGFYEQSADVFSDKNAVNKKFIYFTIYKVFFSIPFSIFSSFIVINLTYRSIINLIDYILRNRSILIKPIDHNEDSFCCNLFAVNDEHELIYSKYDILYVIELLDQRGGGSQETAKKSFKTFENYEYSKLKIENKNILAKVKNIFKKLLDWDANFRFTSRFMNTMLVALVALYYFVIYLSYLMAYYGNKLSELLDFVLEVVDQINGIEINPGDILCSFSQDICIEALKVPFKLPNLPINHFGGVRESVIAIFVVPLFASLLICLVQLYLLSRDTKTHIKQLYKGTCEFVLKANKIPSPSIASSSFHFGG